MATTHISENDAAKDFAGVMSKLRAGEEIAIESSEHPVAVLKLVVPFKGRPASEVLASLRARSKERGYSLSMDDAFVADMEEIIRSRKPADHSAWD
jgi:antitoxin (DNA-binding transcriptional repressor) of toxin-antitoxin stability system